MESSIKKTLPELRQTFNRSLPQSISRNNSHSPGLTGNFAVIGLILQQPAQFFEEIQAGINLSGKIWALFISSVVFLASYGAVLGSGHLLLSLGVAVAIPFLFFGTLVACLPAMYLLDVLSGSQRSLGQMTVVILASTGVAATVFFSFAPIVVLFKLTGTLEQFLWLNIAILGLATLVGLFYVTRGLIQTAIVDPAHTLGSLNRWLHFLWILLFMVVISQMAWGLLSFFQKTGGFFNFMV